MHSHRLLLGLSPLAAGVLTLGVHCTSHTPSGGPSTDATTITWKHPQGTVSVVVTADPFALSVLDPSGNVLLESATAHEGADASDPLDAYAPLAFTHNTDQSTAFIMK